MCSPSVHFQEPPSFLFVTHLYYSDLIWVTKLPAQDAPVGFYGTGVTVLGFHGASSLRQRVFYSDARFSIEKEQPQLPIRSAHNTPASRGAHANLPHRVSGYNSATSCQWIQLSGYNKRPRIFRYGVFFKNKPAMTYSPTPTKVQYHRREES